MLLVDHEYHGCELAQQLPDDIKEWLVENFGPPNGNQWYLHNNSIYFANKLDHMMFLVRVS